jgi:hypothetical protein
VKNTDTPQYFNPEIRQNSHIIEYKNVLEVGQGGPRVGEITVDGIALSPGLKFGGPLLADGSFIFAPILKKKFLGSYFSLVKVNLTSGNLVDFNLKEDLIFLDRIEAGSLIYYNTFNKSSKPIYVKLLDPL